MEPVERRYSGYVGELDEHGDDGLPLRGGAPRSGLRAERRRGYRARVLGGRTLTTALAVVFTVGAACNAVGDKGLSSAQSAELCEAVSDLTLAVDQPDDEAVATYRSAVARIDDVAEAAPSSSAAQKARVARLRAITSAARLASIHAQTHNGVEREVAETALAESSAALRDCSSDN